MYILRVLLVFSLLGAHFFPAVSIAQSTEDTEPTTISQLSFSSHSIDFTFNTPSFLVSEDGTPSAGNLPLFRQPGAPHLPYYKTFIALPPKATPQINITTQQIQQQTINSLSYEPTPVAPAYDVATNYQSNSPILFTYTQDASIYTRDDFYPYQTYSLSEPMYFRDIRMVELTLYPFQYNPTKNKLQSTKTINVHIDFVGADDIQTTPLKETTNTSHLMDSLVLNSQQIDKWRSLPANFVGTPTDFPIGQDTYKIEVNEDGIYEITGAMLEAAGMNIAGINANTLYLGHRGEPIAYEFIGDPNDGLDNTDAIRFYGSTFKGSRLDAQYINNNIYWLWANDTPSLIATGTNPTGHPIATNYPASVTREVNRVWHSTWFNNWEEMPNEPDAWYWDNFTNGETNTYNISLPDADPTGSDVSFLAEVTSRASLGEIALTHEMEVSLNNHPNIATDTWRGKQNRNITGSIPISALTTNSQVTITATQTVNSIFLNRITVEYDRLFKTINDQLIFTIPQNNQTFNISDYTIGSATESIVWNISNPLSPISIPLTAGNITDDGGTFTYSFGSDTAGTFIVTNQSQIKTPVQITQYIPSSLDPSGTTSVDWLAITHPDFRSQAERLATHRADTAFGGYRTHIVEIEDIINQYGYGFPTPQAYQDFLAYTLVNWDTAPHYITLIGDATINPKALNCEQNCYTGFNDHEINYVPTSLSFADRFQGLVPSDTPPVLVVGDDLIPDFAIGRLPAKTLTEATNMVDKIIAYETNQFTPQEWMQKVVFVADQFDGNNNFCTANQQMANRLPSSFNTMVDEFCLPNPTQVPTDTENLFFALSNEINNVDKGMTLLNYRGHGSVTEWGAAATILSTGNLSLWNNATRPVVLMSADCLDGYFSLPNRQGLAETFFKSPDNGGTAAHWSSSGLDFTTEHTILEQGFYDGVFEYGATSMGDATLYAKQNYLLQGNFESIIYTFTLLGDPAMQLYRPDPTITLTPQHPSVSPGSSTTIDVEITNAGIAPVYPEITIALPAGVNYIDVTSSDTTFDVTLDRNNVIITSHEFLHWNDIDQFELQISVNESYSEPQVTIQATIDSAGLDLNADNNIDTIQISTEQSLYLPFVVKTP